MVCIALIGPTSSTWAEIADEVEVDLRRLRRPGLELVYRTTGAGPVSIRSRADAEAAAPHVVATARTLADEGVDGIVVDCTDDPGVERAERAIGLPVVGAGAALREAVAVAPRPVRTVDGDVLRRTSGDDVVDLATGVRTVAFGGTGFAPLAERLEAAAPEVTVIEPLAAAVELCLRRLADR